MRTALRLTLGIAALVSLTYAIDSLKSLGISDTNAKENTMSALDNGWLPYGDARQAFKAANASTQLAIVKASLEWVKSYTASPEFTADYARIRNEHKPEAFKVTGTPADDVKKQREEQEQQIAEMKKNVATLPDEQRKAAEEGIKQAMESMKQMQNDASLQQAMLKAAESKREEDKLEHDADVLEWQTRYPEDPRQLIRQRIKQFLLVSGSVDFDAKLVDNGGRKRFANPDYEAKTGEWKFCFRAGRANVAAARAFATAWLAEIEKR